MDYGRIYKEFIADRRFKEPSSGDFDVHHIVPRSLGGSNEPDNLIRLVPQDHIFAHALLAKIHGGLLIGALLLMAGKHRYAGRYSRLRYAHFRRGHPGALRAQWADPDKREAMLTKKFISLRSKDLIPRWHRNWSRQRHFVNVQRRWGEPKNRRDFSLPPSERKLSRCL